MKIRTIEIVTNEEDPGWYSAKVYFHEQAGVTSRGDFGSEKAAMEWAIKQPHPAVFSAKQVTSKGKFGCD